MPNLMEICLATFNVILRKVLGFFVDTVYDSTSISSAVRLPFEEEEEEAFILCKINKAE